MPDDRLQRKSRAMLTTTKRDIVDAIAGRTLIRRSDVQTVVQGFLDQIVSELRQGQRLEFRDFGVYELKHRPARLAQNPRTMEKVVVPAHSVVKFKPGRNLRFDDLAIPNAAPTPQSSTSASNPNAQIEPKRPGGKRSGSDLSADIEIKPAPKAAKRKTKKSRD
jgi:integration host factor subunit beta